MKVTRIATLLALWACAAIAGEPEGPPVGLKTYRDLGLTVDETMLARAWKDGVGKPVAAQKTLVKDAWVFPLFDKGNQFKLVLGREASNLPRFDNPRALWCTYSKDAGATWSELRFVAAALDASASIRNLEFRKVSGKALHITFENGAGGKFWIRFKEDDLCRLATIEDLRRAPAGNFVLKSVPADQHDPELPADALCIGSDIAFAAAHPPRGYKVSGELGLLTHENITGQVIHGAQNPAGTLYETRAVVTPKGDYLVLIPDGSHANSPREDANKFLAYRSSDQGKTWVGPFPPFPDQAKHHAALALVPRGGDRIYVFETQRGAVVKPMKGDRAFGYRFSDDDGRTWSPVQLVRLENGTTFGGTAVIEMTATTADTWMAGFHHSRMLRGALEGGQRRWSVVTPDPPLPKTLPSLYFMDELRVLGLAGPQVLAMARTCEGHLWEMRSPDDGRTWAHVQPTALVQPDAPPMIFHLSDRKTLIALHHNRAVLRSVHEPVHSDWLRMPSPSAEEIASHNEHRHSLKDWVSRAEVWFSLSKDEGATWSEPRFLFANALAETLESTNPNYQCSYVDLFTDRGFVHLFIPHRWQRVVHLAFPEDQLGAFLTREELARAL